MSKYLPTFAGAIKIALVSYIVFVVVTKFPSLNLASKL